MSLPVTHNETGQQTTRTNRKIVSAVAVGLSVFGCSMLVTNMTKTNVAPAVDVVANSVASERNLGAKSVSSHISPKPAEGLYEKSSKKKNPTKSPSSGIHKPTWKPSKKPSEHSSDLSKDAKVGIAHLRDEIRDDKKDLRKADLRVEKNMIKNDIRIAEQTIENDKILILNEKQLSKGKATVAKDAPPLPTNIKAPLKGTALLPPKMSTKNDKRVLHPEKSSKSDERVF